MKTLIARIIAYTIIIPIAIYLYVKDIIKQLGGRK